MMVAVLGLTHLVFGLADFQQLSARHEEQMRADMEARPRMFDALLGQAGQTLGELAQQIAIASAASPTGSSDALLTQTETLGSITAVEFFDAQGGSLMAWDAPGSTRPSAKAQYPAAVASVLSKDQPTTLVDCRRECAIYAFIPFLDNAGNKRVVAVGQPITEILLSFQRLNGADVGILHDEPAADAPGTPPLRLWNRGLLAITHAPQLIPLLETLKMASTNADDATVKATAQGRSLRLLRAPLPRSPGEVSELLFVVDETDTLAAIRAQSLRRLGLNALTLFLSSSAVYLLLTPALRRLSQVTQALPLLAERRFASSREHLRSAPSNRRRDEIDILHDAALALSYRLESLDEAEARSAEKSHFLATMSHEIRTPMNGILGLLELLETGELSAEQRDAVRTTRASGRTLLGIIDDILDFSRLESSEIKIEQIPISLCEVLEGTVDTLAPSARSKGLRLTVFADPALPSLVAGDPHRLRQILFNLCSNAIKFTATGFVRVRAIPVPGGVRGQRVQFHVVDSGIGLPPQAHEILFKPFTQADSSTTRRFGGTGLGLSIVRGLVQRMGGTVDFSSEEGLGSDFWCEIDFPVIALETEAMASDSALPGVDVCVDLPDRAEAADLETYARSAGAGCEKGDACLELVESSRPEEAHTWIDIRSGDRTVDSISRPIRRSELFRRLRVAAGLDTPSAERVSSSSTTNLPNAEGPWILVAEDHSVNQQVIHRQLTRLGYRPVLAGDGREALQKIGERDFAVLLADLHMPHMDGIELTRAVREAEARSEGSRRLPIIALTAAALSGERFRCREVGMDGFLLKPTGLDRLREVLGQYAPIVMTVTPSAPPRVALEASVPPVDMELLLDLVDGDRAFAEQLLGDFLRINAPLMGDLQRQMDSAWDGREVRERAHRLLGSARTLGAKQLAAELSLLETCAEQNQPIAAIAAWPKVRKAFDEVQTFILARAG